MSTLYEEVRAYFIENKIPVDDEEEETEIEEDIDEIVDNEEDIDEIVASEEPDEVLEMPGDELVRNIPPSDGPLLMPEEYQPAPRTKRVLDSQPHGGTTNDLEVLQDPEFYE